MARVTVEDCIDKVENRFDLVLLASHRARMISSGSQITIDRDNDKNPVVSLREIAEKTVSPEDLKEDLIHSLQKYVEVDEPESDDVPLIAGAGGSVDSDDTTVVAEHMSEEELLKGLEGLAPPEEQPEPDDARIRLQHSCQRPGDSRPKDASLRSPAAGPLIFCEVVPSVFFFHEPLFGCDLAASSNRRDILTVGRQPARRKS